MTKHTRRPWTARQNRWSRWEILGGRGVLAMIATPEDPASPPEDWRECAANAQLIAAAPDLLEALECLLPGLILDLRYADDDDDKDAMRSRIKTVTDALAKTIESSNNGDLK